MQKASAAEPGGGYVYLSYLDSVQYFNGGEWDLTPPDGQKQCALPEKQRRERERVRKLVVRLRW